MAGNYAGRQVRRAGFRPAFFWRRALEQGHIKIHYCSHDYAGTH